MNNLDEFSIINKYFLSKTSQRVDIDLGIGDDCAVISPQLDKKLLISTDCLLENVHFPIGTPADLIAIKSLAVNLSDIAAMGGTPAWFTLVLGLPSSINENWLELFSQSLSAYAKKFNLTLIGGDTVKSDQLSITIQIHGYEYKNIMTRASAQPDDLIVVTGKLGAAALGLKLVLNNSQFNSNLLTSKQIKTAINALNKPTPRVEVGQIISGYSQCAIDISDGLLSDLGHILTQSHCGAILDIDRIPMAECLLPLEKEEALLLALTGGDDYELCFTISQKQWEKLSLEYKDIKQFHLIGHITLEESLNLTSQGKKVTTLCGHSIQQLNTGYNHFV